MKNLTLILFLASILSTCRSTTDSPGNVFDPLPYVNPNIGTAHSRWFFYTPAALPFGMVKPGPTTDAHYGNKSGWEAVGYDDRHSSIEGFAHAREFQIGGIVLMPTTGKLVTVPGELDDPDSGYRSRFSHEEEKAEPGYYKVRLRDYRTTAELTSTDRVGLHRYTFPAQDTANILFDIGNIQGESGPVLDAEVHVLNKREVQGWVMTHPYYTQAYQPGSSAIPIYFYAVSDRAADETGTFRKDSIFPGRQAVKGIGSGAFFRYNTGADSTIEIKVALSYTSIENARKNYAAEAENLDFSAAKEAAQGIWKRELGKIRVEGGRPEDRVKFYTGLYHALLGRGLAHDVNGAYPKHDGSVGQLEMNAEGIPLHRFYNTDAIWGGFWNLTQLWALAWPEYYNDFVQTHLRVYKDAGWLGDGIANSKFVSGVGTNFIGLIMAGAYNCGIRNFDVDLAYEAALQDATVWQNRPPGAGKVDMKGFIQNGYVPFVDTWTATEDGMKFCVSHSLEYAFGSYAIAHWAQQLGRTDDVDYLMDLAGRWRNSYDTVTNFVRPRNPDGEFLENFDPYEPWRGFQEGNAWQYTFYVPHDPEGLIALMGQEAFNNRLDSLFIRSQEQAFGGGKEVNAFSGINSVYNHGNQPSLHIPWLFNFSGKPWLTQKWTRAICNEFYGTDGLHGYGYGQDEDQGQLGAWYVMAALGLLDVKGLSGPKATLQTGSPIFDRVTIQLNPEYAIGKTFVIETTGNGPENVFVQRAMLNGEGLNEARLDFSTIMQGGKLVMEMGSVPNKSWGL